MNPSTLASNSGRCVSNSLYRLRSHSNQVVRRWKSAVVLDATQLNGTVGHLPDGPIGILPPYVDSLVHEFASQKHTVTSLNDLTRFGKPENEPAGQPPLEFMGRLGRRLAHERTMMSFAQVLQEEVPIRLAQRVLDLDQVPYLRDMPSVQKAKGVYLDSFLKILALLEECPDELTCPDQEEQFYKLLLDMEHRHSSVLLQLAKGTWEFRKQIFVGNIPNASFDHEGYVEFAQQDECHSFLDNFYASRVGLRVLVGQYLALRSQLLEEDDGDWPPDSNPYHGMICEETNPLDVIQVAVQDATDLCVARFGSAPRVQVTGQLDFNFPYVPAHLHYILVELLKNSFRATMEFHAHREQKPDVVVAVAGGAYGNSDEIGIRVTDEGGGIRRSQMDHIWSYLYTTADPTVQYKFLKQQLEEHSHENHSVVSSEEDPIMAGLGFGLPLSRAYARYFGGDLTLKSMEQYGTDAFCYLNRLQDKTPVLP